MPINVNVNYVVNCFQFPIFREDSQDRSPYLPFQSVVNCFQFPIFREDSQVVSFKS